MKSNLIIIGCIMLGLLVSAPLATAQVGYDYEVAYGYGSQDSGLRNAVDMDDWLERGYASVTESPLFSGGIRLTASASEKAGIYEPGLASAIYYFAVPQWAQYLKISIRYKDVAKDDKIAGRLWIKSTDNSIRGNTEPGEAVPFYGDTFVLGSELLLETITVPAYRHVENGTLEVHIVVDGTDCIDVRDIQVEYLATQPQVAIVHRPYDDYWDQLPRYRYSFHYYYWGPLFWPKTYSSFECWDVPARFYWGTWRPWFRAYVKGFSKHSWWEPRQYTVIYHDDVKRPPLERRSLLQQRLRERHEHAAPVTPVPSLTQQTTQWPTQNHPSQNREIRLKEAGSNRSSGTAVNQKPTQIQQKGQPIQADRQREKTMVPSQTKTEKHQVVNGPGSRLSPSSSNAPQRTQRDHVTPQTSVMQPRPNLVVKEAAQPPAGTSTPQGKGTRQEQKGGVTAASGQLVTPQLHQQTQQPRSFNEGAKPQPQAAAPQPRPSTVIKEVAQPPAGTHTPQVSGTRQEQKVQRPATIGQQNVPQPRSYNEGAKPQPQAAAPQPRPSPVVKEAAQAPTRTHTPQVSGTRQEPRAQESIIIGQQGMSQPRQETPQPRSSGGEKDR